MNRECNVTQRVQTPNGCDTAGSFSLRMVASSLMGSLSTTNQNVIPKARITSSGTRADLRLFDLCRGTLLQSLLKTSESFSLSSSTSLPTLFLITPISFVLWIPTWPNTLNDAQG